MDGHPRLVIQGAQYLYEFEVQDRAGHYWYHPHPDDRRDHRFTGAWQDISLSVTTRNLRCGCPQANMKFRLSFRIALLTAITSSPIYPIIWMQ